MNVDKYLEFVDANFAPKLPTYGDASNVPGHYELADTLAKPIETAVEAAVVSGHLGLMQQAWTTLSFMITGLLGTLSGLEAAIDDARPAQNSAEPELTEAGA